MLINLCIIHLLDIFHSNICSELHSENGCSKVDISQKKIESYRYRKRLQRRIDLPFVSFILYFNFNFRVLSSLFHTIPTTLLLIRHSSDPLLCQGRLKLTWICMCHWFLQGRNNELSVFECPALRTVYGPWQKLHVVWKK